MSRRLSLLIALAIPAAVGGSVLAAELVLPAAERSGLSITLYQGDLAQIRDRRAAGLDRGGNSVTLDGIPRAIQPGSAMLSGPGITVSERATDTAPLSGERLLAANLGRMVTVFWPGESPLRVKVLAAEGIPLFEADGKVIAGTPDRIVYDGMPPGLSPRPAFRARLTAEQAGPRDLELSYLTGGLGWSAEATGELDGDKMLLTVWATLGNTSGADFNDASLRLVAGTLHQAGNFSPKMLGAPRAMAAMAEPAREALGPYHVYTIAHPVSLRDGETRQVPLLPPAQASVRRELILDPLPPQFFSIRMAEPQRQHPVLVVELTNTAKAGLGRPIPAALVRVTMRGPGGEATLLGEDHLAALPEGATARLTLGQAFDITATRLQTDFQKVSNDVTEAEWKVRLTNGGERAETVTLREAFRSDWLVIDESAAHVKDSAGTARWSVTIPAKGEAELRYRVRVKG